MAARAISSGTISFGLVSIPVKVYSATRSKSVNFNMLHKADSSRLKRQMVCATCGEKVDNSETVRGYEYSRGQYVILSEDELKGLQKKTDQSIEIEEFIPIEKVDPVYFEKTQLLGPDKGGNKAYTLLRDAMLESGRVAVGRFATRGKEQLVIIRPVARGLMLHGLYYADEVRNFDDIDLGDPVELKDGELGLAEQLIDQLSRKTFEPDRFEDGYRLAVLEAVDRKVAGEEIVVMPKEEARDQIIDLVAALKKSLADKQEAGGPATRKPARKKAARKASKKKSASR
jgi:DNA end-binding protein Ku